MSDSDSRDSLRRLGSVFVPSDLLQYRESAGSTKSSSAEEHYANAKELMNELLSRSHVSKPDIASPLLAFSATKMLEKYATASISAAANYLKNSTSATVENIENERRLLELRTTFSHKILGILRETFIEPGVVSEADTIVYASIQQNRLATQSWINELFIEYFSQPAIAAGLLLLIGRLPYAEAAPTGPTMATAALSHTNAEVAEAAVRAFEHWASPQSLTVLERVQSPHEWLNEYIGSVIEDIKSELCD